MDPYCREILERAVVLLDGEISMITEAQRVEIETHLEECGPCLERYGFERDFLISVVGRLQVHPSRCPDELRDRISGLLEEA
jgi:mycothiol system anti-sigma-R factor